MIERVLFSVGKADPLVVRVFTGPRVLGEDHPRTLAVGNNLAAALQRLQ